MLANFAIGDKLADLHSSPSEEILGSPQSTQSVRSNVRILFSADRMAVARSTTVRVTLKNGNHARALNPLRRDIDPRRLCLAPLSRARRCYPFVNRLYAPIAFGVLRFNQENTHSISAAVVPNMARVLPVSGVRVSSVN
jgi:hypothetical protein